MKKLLRGVAAVAVTALIAVCASVTVFAENIGKNEKTQTAREEQFLNCVYNELYSEKTKEQLRVSQPFRIYNADGTLSNYYHYFVFDGDKIITNLELIEDEKGLRFYSLGGRAYEEVEAAYLNGTEIALVMRKDEVVYMTTKNSRTLLVSTPTTEKKAAPKFVKLEKIKLTDINIPDDFYEKKWEEELIYYSKYRKHKDEDFYENSIAKDGGYKQWRLSFEEADLFRNAGEQVIQLKYEDIEGEKIHNVSLDTKVRINLYLSFHDCYTYTIDLKESFCASIPDILKETGLLENKKYKDIIGIIIESDTGYDDGAVKGRCMTGYVFSPKGWIKNGDNVYYVTKDLTLAKGSYLVKGIPYRFDDNGALQGAYTGWTRSDGKLKYWVNGKCMQSRLFDVNGKRWCADDKGYVTPYVG